MWKSYFLRLLKILACNINVSLITKESFVNPFFRSLKRRFITFELAINNDYIFYSFLILNKTFYMRAHHIIFKTHFLKIPQKCSMKILRHFKRYIVWLMVFWHIWTVSLCFKFIWRLRLNFNENILIIVDFRIKMHWNFTMLYQFWQFPRYLFRYVLLFPNSNINLI